MNNKEIAHLWANKSKTEANGSHFFFRGDTIYSYGGHFPVARHYKGVVLFTTRDYSNTTARHKGIARMACSHLPVFLVTDPSANPSGKDVKAYGDCIEARALQAGRARNPAFALEMLEQKVSEANEFCKLFGFKTRFDMPGNIEELKLKASESAAWERKAKARKDADFKKQCEEVVSKWLSGESVSIPHQLGKVYLRAREGSMETSKGAIVPLDQAQLAFRFANKHRESGWHRNGSTFTVGSYQLDSVNAQGVVAGCHRITWDEIDRFATIQGWL